MTRRADTPPRSGEATVGVLVNPAAGLGRGAREVAAVLGAVRAAGLGVVEIVAPDARSAGTVCAAAVADGIDALVAVGGDGTVNLAVQAVAGTSTALGIVPCGTGNDLAVSLGVPVDPVHAATALAGRLLGGDVARVDAVRTTAGDGTPRPWWACVLASGFDSAVNERANRMRWPRGPRRYDVAILAELARLRPRPYRLTLDGREVEFPAIMVAVGNTDSYGGGMRICPDADPADGLLDVTVVGPIGRAELVRVKPRLYAGTHVEDPRVTTYRAAEVRLEAPGVVAYADGEPLAPLPLTLTCVPGALRVLAPGRAVEPRS